MLSKKQPFPYNWKLSEIKKASMPYHGKKAFSCFAGGGGSSMGYKLAGYDVIGYNEIDNRMSQCYGKNLKPQIAFKEDIRNVLKKKLPKELFNLDILDGSPPCTLFSVANINRKRNLGKEKKFREGQKEQVLDTLFFDFIRLAGLLRPKVVVAENVLGMLKENTIKYVQRIIKAFTNAGYLINVYQINTKKMGLPQERRRLIFTAIRKDMINNKIKTMGIEYKMPLIDFTFNGKEIPFKKIIIEAKKLKQIKAKNKRCIFINNNWSKIKPGQCFDKIHSKKHFFNHYKLSLNKPVPVLLTNPWHYIHPIENRPINIREFQLCNSFPLDYDFLNENPYYIMGMSVPPVMMAQIAREIKYQWLDKIK